MRERERERERGGEREELVTQPPEHIRTYRISAYQTPFCRHVIKSHTEVIEYESSCSLFRHFIAYSTVQTHIYFSLWHIAVGHNPLQVNETKNTENIRYKDNATTQYSPFK